jgi:hypothetical protein
MRAMPLLLGAASVLLALGVGLTINRPAPPDARYVTYRYAEHLAEQGRISYNPDQATAYGPPPLEIILLATGARALPALDTPLNIALIALSALGIFVFLSGDPEQRLPSWVGLSGAALYVVSPLPWQALYSGQHLAITLALWMLIALQGRRYVVAGILAGLSILAGPEVLLLIGILAISKGGTPRFWKSFVAVMILCAFAVAVVKIPWRPLVLEPDATDPIRAIEALLVANPLLILMVIPMLWGWSSMSTTKRVVVAWGALHTVVTWGLLGNLNLLPLWIGAVVLAAFGLTCCPRWVRVGVISLLLVGQASALAVMPPNTADSERNEQIEAGQWLAENTPAGSTVGGSAISPLAYFSRRTFVDVQGRLEADAAAAIGRGDPYYGMLHALPDYFVRQKANSPSAWDTKLDDLLITAYQPATVVGDTTIYARRFTRQELKYVRDADLKVSDQLRLVGITQSALALTPGQWLYVRLDWIASEGLGPYRLDLTIVKPPEQVVSQLSEEFFNARWQAGPFSTYHLIKLPDRPLPDGLLPILVKASYLPPAPDYAAVVVSQARAKLPQPDLPASGKQAEFGNGDNQVRLRAATAKLGDTRKLALTLYWESSGPLAADYRVFTHLYALGKDTSILVQSDGPPTYPTSTWEAGEIFANQHELDLANLPAGTYQVRIGLYTPETGRLLLPDGQDSLSIYVVQIAETGAISVDTVP